jgi:hypothetical protein
MAEIPFSNPLKSSKRKASLLAAEVFTSGDAARTQDRESSDGAKAGCLFVLDVAQGMELSATLKVRFARGTARKRPWCEIDHRHIDWASRSPRQGEFEIVIMVDRAIGEMVGSD